MTLGGWFLPGFTQAELPQEALGFKPLGVWFLIKAFLIVEE